MRKAAVLVPAVATVVVAGSLAMFAWETARPGVAPAPEAAPRELAVVIDPELTDDHAWRVGRNPPGPTVNRWIDLATDILDDGRLHVVRRLRRPDFEDVTELWLDSTSPADPGVAVRSWTRELATGAAWHVHDIEGTVRLSSAHPPTELREDPLVVEYEFRGMQSGSEQRLRGKFALDVPIQGK